MSIAKDSLYSSPDDIEFIPQFQRVSISGDDNTGVSFFFETEFFSFVFVLKMLCQFDNLIVLKLLIKVSIYYYQISIHTCECSKFEYTAGCDKKFLLKN